ncbi:MAG TPA: S46 family peptidase [Longimicrobiales bacterium]
MILTKTTKALFAALSITASSLHAQDATTAGRFDAGKMWTFEYAPKSYFSQTYKFDANDQWFERARLAALRIPGCSASFVSGNGLIVTNHHCARGHILNVSKPGEQLERTGFYAATPQEERPVPNFTADQLIAIQDVSAEVFAATDRVTGDSARAAARRSVAQRIETRLREQHKQEGTGVLVQIVPLYAGGRYSAYVFRRYTDVRLVAAPELQLGFFGGDADNFTYPRYALDFAFLRVYGPDGRPLNSPNHFKWSARGVQQNDVVFVIGNPGPTTRMNSVAQLEFIRDVQLPATLKVQQSRWDALNAEFSKNPEAPNAFVIQNQMFSLSNRLKAGYGRLAALHDSTIMGRRRAAERHLIVTIAAKPELRAKYGDVINRLADVQQRKLRFADAYAATLMFGDPAITPNVLRRAQVARLLLRAQKAGVAADSIEVLRRRLGSIAQQPPALERNLLAAQFAQWGAWLPASDTALLRMSALADSAGAALALAAGRVTLDDPAIRVVETFMARASGFVPEWQKLMAEEAELNAQLGRARFEIYGTDVPPDATSSPRITDGVVLPYDYNGTIAPVYTTFFGMYDRNRSFGQDSEWALPDRWLKPAATLELGTPLNFISTADTYGGNSGSPAVTKDLELVGLNFDRNINGLSRDYVYLPEKGRNIMVDVRAIAESLRSVYRAQRVLDEILGR